MEKDKITLPSGETFSKWRFIDIDRIEYSEEHKDKFTIASKLYGKLYSESMELFNEMNNSSHVWRHVYLCLIHKTNFDWMIG